MVGYLQIELHSPFSPSNSICHSQPLLCNRLLTLALLSPPPSSSPPPHSLILFHFILRQGFTLKLSLKFTVYPSGSVNHKRKPDKVKLRLEAPRTLKGWYQLHLLLAPCPCHVATASHRIVTISHMGQHPPKPLRMQMRHP